ncbi:beta-N-acetylhexosaminidase [uncultured Thiothrix sp.]|uniref:beta-N-acetylhexosaminidase n=1 Tax=uncultured Thiothrix sp. TaxID=223185 RepID=UPI00260B8153|nr:beta-N-acetylhexosaminidase [uncultured Thiothrix sp.]HMT93729.1 beta-N-acetylhexosaminidase [Thiolinea sp.]
MPIGSLMMDLTGTDLSAEEVDLLAHPAIGGVIFFTRNYESVQQLTALVKLVRMAAQRPLLLAVDHEGGRVQRFRKQFTRLPAIAKLGESYTQNPLEARQLAYRTGWLMAAEVRAVDIDISFAPVLDLNYGVSQVIGDRAFHQNPEIVTELAGAYISGMREAGMASTGKHFPGHGFVEADSHLAIPLDLRPKEQIMQADVLPFARLMQQGLNAVMPAHVIYEQVDTQPAGFSRIWLQDILRTQLGFEGVIFSDDLSMEAAGVVGGYAERAEAALAAGCDMILACNKRAGIIEILDQVKLQTSEASAKRLQSMLGTSFMNRSALLEQTYWQQTVEEISHLA